MPTTLVASPTFATSLGVEGLIPEHSVSKAENPNLVYQPSVQPPQDPAPSPLQNDKVNSPYINISTENVTYDTTLSAFDNNSISSSAPSLRRSTRESAAVHANQFMQTSCVVRLCEASHEFLQLVWKVFDFFLFNKIGIWHSNLPAIIVIS